MKTIEESKKEIECDFKSCPVCPYCGKEHRDWEAMDGGKFQCWLCEKWFEVEPDFTVSYSTKKVDCMNGSPHSWRVDDWYPGTPKKHYHCRVCDKHEYRAAE